MALETLFPDDRISRRAFRHMLASPNHRVIVADLAGTVAGDAVVAFRRGSTVARLYSLVVDARWRGRGLGALLLAHAEALAFANGARTMQLEVRVDNEAALALYQVGGYGRGRRLRGYYADGCDGVRLFKPLGPTGVHPPDSG